MVGLRQGYPPEEAGLLDRLTAPRSSMALSFRPVDVAEQARARRLAQRGREDGSRNLPGTASDEMALAEQDVIAAVSAERDRCASLLSAQLRAHRDALSHLQTAMDIAAMRQSADDALSRLGEIRISSSGEVAELRRLAGCAEAELAEFKEANGIRRQARLPNSPGRTFAWLFVCIVAESCLNGTFFAEGSDFGLLGGIALAMALSAVNVTISAAGGFVLLRHARADRPVGASFAGAAFVLLSASILGLNGFIAHFRDLYRSSGDVTDVQLAWSNLLHRPCDISSIQSWLLFALGGGFAAFAMKKGYGLDDPIPGYGGFERRRLAARDAHLGSRADLLEDAREVRDEFLDDAKSATERLRGASAQRKQILGARARMLAEYGSIESDLEAAGQQLLATYRQENALARADEPPPHFARRLAFPDRALERPEFRSLLTDQGMEHDAETLIDELDGLRRHVLDAHAALLAQTLGEG